MKSSCCQSTLLGKEGAGVGGQDDLLGRTATELSTTAGKSCFYRGRTNVPKVFRELFRSAKSYLAQPETLIFLINSGRL